MIKNRQISLYSSYALFLILGAVIFLGGTLLSGGDAAFFKGIDQELPFFSWGLFFFLMFFLVNEKLDKGIIYADRPCLSVANIPAPDRAVYYRKILFLELTLIFLTLLLCGLEFVLWISYLGLFFENVTRAKFLFVYSCSLSYVGHLIAGLLAFFFLGAKFIRCYYFQDKAIPTSEGLKSLTRKEKFFLL